MALIDVNYITDAALIEKYLGTSTPASSPLNKIAGAAEIFQSIGQGIWELAKSLWDPENPIKSVINLTLTGLITIFGPWWMGLIYVIATEFFGVDFGSLLEKVKNNVVATLTAKKSISGTDVDKSVETAIGGSPASDHVTAEQTERMFKKMAKLQELFRDEMIIQGSIHREAQGALLSMLLKPIKMLVSPPVAKTFMGKVLKFIFKTFLIGIAKAKAGQLGRGLVGGIGPGGATAPSTSSSGKIPHKLKSNPGFGTQQEPGNWEEDFALSNTANEIASWATQCYPQLNSKKNEMMQTQSFKNVVKAIQDNNSRNHYPNTTYIPHKILGETVNTKTELVDLFVGEIAAKLGL